MSAVPHIIDKEECIACGTCAENCPVECISESENGEFYIIDAEACTDCGTCAEVCPVQCIQAE